VLQLVLWKEWQDLMARQMTEDETFWGRALAWKFIEDEKPGSFRSLFLCCLFVDQSRQGTSIDVFHQSRTRNVCIEVSVRVVFLFGLWWQRLFGSTLKRVYSQLCTEDSVLASAGKVPSKTNEVSARVK